MSRKTVLILLLMCMAVSVTAMNIPSQGGDEDHTGGRIQSGGGELTDKELILVIVAI